MKKLRAVVVVAAIAALAIGLLAGCSCSSGGSSKTDFGWYKASVPEGFTDVKESGKEGQKFTKKQGSDELIIKVYNKTKMSTTPDAAAEKKKAMERDATYTDKGQLKAGKYNWEILGFTWNSNTPSIKAYADVDDKNYVELDFFMMDENNPDVKSFLESFEYVGEKASNSSK